MIFNSYAFLTFALLFFSVFYLIPKNWKLPFVLLSSYFFYGFWDYRYLGLILISTLVDYVIAILIHRERHQWKKKWLLGLSIFVNLGILVVFKYFNFFSDSFIGVAKTFGWRVDTITLDFLLPVGISFYTFQTLSYSIDVYRGRFVPEKNFIRFSTFVAYFPQLVAGPIERASHLLPQIRQLSQPSRTQIFEGLSLILWGYFLKVVIADNVARVVDLAFSHSHARSSIEAWTAVLAFSLQIYGDFSGYSKIARGVSKLMGIELMRNFWHPYLAKNPSDFWKRWHISLSTWLKDYLYISLGGNRVSERITYRNLLITMVLGGLWHGASWIFVLWGLYQGLLLVGHRYLVQSKNYFQRIRRYISAPFILFFFTIYGWLIFRSKDLPQFASFTRKMLNLNELFTTPLTQTDLINGIWIVLFFGLVLFVDYWIEKSGDEYFIKFNRISGYCWSVLIILSLIFIGGGSDSFIYFQF